jgi:hypothetical protein
MSAVRDTIAVGIVAVIFIHVDMSIPELKRRVQGPFGTSDVRTIRGVLAHKLGGSHEGYVHIPDNAAKLEEDLRALDECGV